MGPRELNYLVGPKQRKVSVQLLSSEQQEAAVRITGWGTEVSVIPCLMGEGTRSACQSNMVGAGKITPEGKSA